MLLEEIFIKPSWKCQWFSLARILSVTAAAWCVCFVPQYRCAVFTWFLHLGIQITWANYNLILYINSFIFITPVNYAWRISCYNCFSPFITALVIYSEEIRCHKHKLISQCFKSWRIRSQRKMKKLITGHSCWAGLLY